MSVETASDTYYSNRFQNSSTTLVDTNIINVKANKTDDELLKYLTTQTNLESRFYCIPALQP